MDTSVSRLVGHRLVIAKQERQPASFDMNPILFRPLIREYHSKQGHLMPTVFSNGGSGDFVIGMYQKCLAESTTLFVASPFVTLTDELGKAAKAGKGVSLLVGLNASTKPAALRAIFGIPNLPVRYYTHRRFHAKIYLFDTCALVGSSNLTEGGMVRNREATILIEDPEQLVELRALYEGLWTNAPVLTPEVLTAFEAANASFGQYFDPNANIEEKIGRAEPPNVAVGSAKKSQEYLFLEGLRRRIYEQFKPAFDEVTTTLDEHDLHRPEWTSSDGASETNRFLNWVRLVHGAGDRWQASPRRSLEDRRSVILGLGREWVSTDQPQIAPDYFGNLARLRSVFASKVALSSSSQGELFAALMGVHAFEERVRFVKDGYAGVFDFFWNENGDDVDRVKRTLDHLVFGPGEFVRRLYEVLNFPHWKIRYFADSCATELSGTVRPDVCPPVNGRSAKGLRYLGFQVPAA